MAADPKKERFEGAGAAVWDGDEEFRARFDPCLPFACAAVLVSSLFEAVGIFVLWRIIVPPPGLPPWTASEWPVRAAFLAVFVVWTGLAALWEYVALRGTLPRYIIVDKALRRVTFRQFLSNKTVDVEDVGEVFLDLRCGRGWSAMLAIKAVDGKRIFRDILQSDWADEYKEALDDCLPFVERVARAVGRKAKYTPEEKDS